MSRSIEIVLEREDLSLPQLPASSPAGEARLQVLKNLAKAAFSPTSHVEYDIGSRLLIIGSLASARAALESLDESFDAVVLAAIDTQEFGNLPEKDGNFYLQLPDDRAVPVFNLPIESIGGYAGAFDVVVRDAGQDGSVALAGLLHPPRQAFDLVLDLSRDPFLKDDRLPAGYFAPCNDWQQMHDICANLTDYIGAFEKPEYVSYQVEKCAHGARGLTGCTNCLDACPSQAIRSEGESIVIDPYRCQGVGCCATVCPGGAIEYRYPVVQEHVRDLLAAIAPFQVTELPFPALLIHSDARKNSVIRDLIPVLPEWVVPVAVEDVCQLGFDTWITLLVHGVSCLLIDDQWLSASERAVLEKQISMLQAIVNGLGIPGQHIFCLSDWMPENTPRQTLPVKTLTAEPARYSISTDKRQRTYDAVDYLYRQLKSPVADLSLPAGAPFGRVLVDQDKCTLCMACVAVCPPFALQAFEETPRLSFLEGLCLQCGLCQAACPETAIRLESRLLCNYSDRRSAQVLKEEAPFECIHCGKAFATQSVIRIMQEKLASHPMFAGDAAKRLKMCEDCRVKDMMHESF